MELFRIKARERSAKELLHAYQNNRFVTPSAIEPLSFLESEVAILATACAHGLTPLILSPLAPFGSCSISGFTDQNKVVTALRGTEVVADATNVLALEAVLKRKAQGFDSRDLHYCASHRHVRAQAFSEKAFTAHFQIFCVVSSGTDPGHFLFEQRSVLKHLEMYSDILLRYPQFSEIIVTIKSLTEQGIINQVAPAVFDFLNARFKRERVTLQMQESPLSEHRYYQHLRFSIDVVVDNQRLNIGDGGFVSWPRQLTGNKKERMLASGIGTELLWKLVNGKLK